MRYTMLAIVIAMGFSQAAHAQSAEETVAFLMNYEEGTPPKDLAKECSATTLSREEVPGGAGYFRVYNWHCEVAHAPDTEGPTHIAAEEKFGIFAESNCQFRVFLNIDSQLTPDDASQQKTHLTGRMDATLDFSGLDLTDFGDDESHPRLQKEVPLLSPHFERGLVKLKPDGTAASTDDTPTPEEAVEFFGHVQPEADPAIYGQSGVRRWKKALVYFHDTYCKGRAF